MTPNDEGLDPKGANAPNDSQADGQVHESDSAAVTSTQARGAFDLRKGKIKREGRSSLYMGVAALVLVVATTIVAGWMWVVSEMRSDTSDIDESQVKADATLEVQEQDDATMQRIKAQKVQELEDERRRAAAEGNRQELKGKEEKEKAADGVGGGRAAAYVQSGEKEMPNKDTPPTPRQRKLAGGVVVQAQVASGSSYNASSTMGGADRMVTGQGGSAGTPPTALDLMGQAEAGSAGNGLDPGNGRASLDQLGGTTFVPSKAVLAPPGKYLVRHNTYTSCVLYTEIVTDYPGLIECRLTEPLYSADGSTVIAEAGDRLTGEQRTEVRPGQTRVFTSWTELETASGVRARLDSLGAGPMGASGTQAWIDNHYMQRFGGAVMLSIIQDALQIAANRAQKSNSDGYTVNNTENSVENIADKALENSINIPPTAYILPGTVMTVVVARDIDFSTVFENR
ncbi:TPA: conjugal transfer protein [Pseudomonas aeruginosa]|nr:conjugal transfer protein [Pseudomonas aeruginosa]